MPRKVAYSGKKKREQLRERNERKREKAKLISDDSFDILGLGVRDQLPSLQSSFVKSTDHDVTTSDFSHKQHSDSRRLVSHFDKLTPEQIRAERLKSMQPFHRLPKDCMEIRPDQFDEYIEFPKRPTWNYDMSKEQVEKQEEESFHAWLKDIEEKYAGQEISWFERNLEVWRQLWRVLEISDVILIVMDIRNPMLHFPRSLYEYVTQTLKRKIIGVFNKTDLVSEFTVFAWKKYFEEKFPNVHIATFSCFPRDPRLIDDTVTYALKKQTKRPKKRYYYAQGVKNILSVCRDIVDKEGVHVDWKSIIAQYDEDSSLNHTDSEGDEDDDSDTGSMVGLDDEFSRILEITGREIQPHKDYITLGLVGHPNVGKSSLINSIMQRTVVSASKTPGHTKHFQTIHIADNVRLCDSPGLVFPALIPKAVQILSGMYPIAQVQEPYSSITYLAEHIPLEQVLSLTPPEDWNEDKQYNRPSWSIDNNKNDILDDIDLDRIKDYQWTSWSICEQFAEQRGFHTAKTAAPDVNRAANNILRLTSEGRILLSFKPPGFFHTTKYEKLRVKEADLKAQEEEEHPPERENLLISKGGFALLSEM
jgi:ribosome biogenesis GTPase A